MTPLSRTSSGADAAGWQTMHVSRSWPAANCRIEDECPCPQEPCGHVAWDRRDPNCPQHSAFKTLRSAHPADECPGAREALRDAQERPA